MIVEPSNQDKDVLSVSEISQKIKLHVETTFLNVKIKGEISNYTQHSSGHHYFSLKDSKAVIDGICWRGTKMTVPLKEGLEIVANGRVTTYPLRSKYQMIVESFTPAGEGALQALLKERYIHFKDKGYFDRKRPIPAFPKVIGVVTSPTGAVIRDILHRIADRFPLHVLVWPVLVQGPGSDQEIAHAIKGFNKLENKPDVLIVARGGGSLEDLWSFNESMVLEAVWESDIPIISAVGHETDVTLVDYVSDKRAPTPTAAAELAVPVRFEIMQDIQQFYYRLYRAMAVVINALKTRLQLFRLISPKQILEGHILRLDDLSERLIKNVSIIIRRRAFELQRYSIKKIRFKGYYQTLHYLFQNLLSSLKHILNKKHYLFGKCQVILEQMSIEKTLKRGFCIPLSAQGKLLQFKNLEDNQSFNLKFYEGIKKVKII